jgi:hypothetical protein
MSRSVFSSWKSVDGKLEDSDYKLCVQEQDGTYEIETSQTHLGIALGPDPKGSGHTIILRIVDDRYLYIFFKQIDCHFHFDLTPETSQKLNPLFILVMS